MDVHVIGVGKDQYNEYLDQMVEGRILPWTEDSQSEGYPVWTDWEAGQRDVYFLNRNSIVDTTFNITPYDPGNPDDYTYIMNLILELRNETGPTDITVSYNIGWNMVGLPLEVEDASYGTLFSDAVDGTLYGYEGTYYGSDVLEMGNGYWLVFTNDGSADISGEAITSLTISLSEGWNLITGISSPVPVESISDPGSIIVSGTIYGYGGTYYNTDAIEPGKGYWVNAFADGEITLSSTALATKTVEPVNHLEGSNTLELSNGTHSSTLYFGKDVAEEHRNSYSLPPTFPHMAFDARFAGNMSYTKDMGEISIINTNSRLTLNYSVNLDPGEHLEWVFTTNSGKEHILNGTGEITLPPETKGMSLEKRAIFPDVYALHQNYPNPFNPVTKITYQLPKESYVVITIYNLAGQKVTTLVDGRRSGGFHAVGWYGKKSNGESVVSGLYFFRIETENFSKTLKMLLLK